MDQEYVPAHPIDAAKPHPDNPRRGQVETIQRSIAANGFYGAVVIQKSTGFILAGAHRVEAARAEGLDTVPALIVDVPDDTAQRIMLVDNRASDLAGYDERELAELLGGIPDQLMLATGYTEDDLAELLRVSGKAGEDATGFLDDLAGDTASTFGAGGQARTDGGEWFNVSVTVNSTDRDAIRAALAEAKDRLGLATSAEAMLAICQHFVARPPARKKVTA